jgi:hypothetical protein
VSNTRRIRKRGDRLPHMDPVTPVNPSVADMLAQIQDQAGLFVLEYQHDDACKTIDTQRWADCTCTAVDHQLLGFAEGGQSA